LDEVRGEAVAPPSASAAGAGAGVVTKGEAEPPSAPVDARNAAPDASGELPLLLPLASTPPARDATRRSACFVSDVAPVVTAVTPKSCSRRFTSAAASCSVRTWKTLRSSAPWTASRVSREPSATMSFWYAMWSSPPGPTIVTTRVLRSTAVTVVDRDATQCTSAYHFSSCASLPSARQQ